MSKVYLATKEDLKNIEGMITFESKEAYEAAKIAGEIADGAIVGYPDDEVIDNNVLAELKNSVSNGKTLVANAITEKGVATDPTDTFSTMASNIELIETGKKSLVLPTNPDLRIESGDSKLTLTWKHPETEVAIDHYNVYTSLTTPSSLNDMTLEGSTSSLGYEMSGLTNNQTYYVGIQSVTSDGYENASIWKVQNGIPSAVRFVVVGNSGRSYYSTDGLNWNTMSGLDGKAHRGITYGDGRFVCVGDGGSSYYSIDGVTWVAMTGIGSSDSLYAVTYGNGRFVCVGYNGKSYYSTNGTSWTAMSGLSEYSYYGVVYGNGQFVTVGEGGRTYYSTDGTSWLSMSGLSTSYSYRGVTYGDGRFVCVGENGTSYYSTDGKKWVEMSGLTTSSYYGVTYCNGRFVAVGASGKSSCSTDGLTWSDMSGLDSDKYSSVTFGNGRFVAVGNSGLSFYSVDGVSWTTMLGLDSSVDYFATTSDKWNEV